VKRFSKSKLLVTGALLLSGTILFAGQQPSPGELGRQQSNTSQAELQPDSAVPAQAPGEIYKAAMHPLEVVRSSLDNWSDAELGALTAGMHKAHDACEAMRPEEFTGDDLFDLARLCGLGQDWSKENAAALAYVASRLQKHRAQVYALSVNALVHLDALDLALETTREMLRVLPYDAEVGYAVRYMKDELDQRSSPSALELAGEEHPALVAALAKHVPLKAAEGDAIMSIGALYESGMELAFWRRYANDTSAAAATQADIDSALAAATAISAEDTARIARIRSRYGLLGKQIPTIPLIRSLELPSAKPTLSLPEGAFTVLVLFPDWCGSCRRMMKSLTEFAKVNKGTPIRAFGLVFEDDSVIPEQTGHKQFLNELKGTSTLVVPAMVVQTFSADEFPLGIVLDGHRNVRFIGVLTANAFNGNGYVEKTIQKMTRASSAGGITPQ